MQTLTPREEEYCALLAQGLQDKQIARKMSVTPNSIRQYAQRIRRKLDVHNRVEVVTECLKKGIVSLCIDDLTNGFAGEYLQAYDLMEAKDVVA